MTNDPSIGDGAQLMDIMQLQATLAGYHLVDPDGVTIEPGSGPLTVDVTFSTQARLDGPAQSVSDVSGLELPDPDPEDPRKALVYLGSSGDVQTLGGIPTDPDPEGSERTGTINPQVPIPDESFVPLAEVYLEGGTGDVSAGDISSLRVPFSMGEGSGINADLHRGREPYTDSDAANAAPVQSVNGQTGDIITGSEFERFTSGGTWSKPDNAALVIVEAIGGGGGGGSGDGSYTSGGGGGYRMRDTLPADQLESNIPVTVGGGGDGFVAGPETPAEPGGDSSFGDYVTAEGGHAGGDEGLDAATGAMWDAWDAGAGGDEEEPGGSSMWSAGGGGAGGMEGGGGENGGDSRNASGGAGGDVEEPGEDGEDGPIAAGAGGGGGGGYDGNRGEDGGDGGVPGGGGGGGGDRGGWSGETNNGHGGDGARGEVRVWTLFERE